MGDVKAKLKRIKVGGTCQSSDITYHKRYRIKVDGEWYEGMFTKQWFGWNFENYGNSGIQLNLIDEVYEVVPVKVDRKRPPVKPVGESAPPPPAKEETK